MNDKTELGLYHYKMIYAIEEKIQTIADENMLFHSITKEIEKHTSAEIGLFFKIKGGKATLMSCFVIDFEKIKDLDFSVESSYLSWAIDYKIPLKSDDISADKRIVHLKHPLSGIGISLNSLLLIPVYIGEEILGAIELFNSKTNFTPQDLKALSIIARHLALNLKNKSLARELGDRCNYLMRIVNSLSSGLMAMSSKEELLLINPKAIELLRIKNKNPSIKDIDKDIYERLKLLMKGGKNLARQEMTYNGKILGYSCVVVKDEKGLTNGIIFLFQDITAYKQKAEVK